MSGDFTNFTQDKPSCPDLRPIPSDYPLSREETTLWQDVRGCDKCRTVLSVRNATPPSRGHVYINGYGLNVDYPTSVYSVCLGKFIGEGPSNAPMFIGMNPGRSHKQHAHTLRGEWPTAGAKLEKAFRSVNRGAGDFYLTNLVKCSTVDDRLTHELVQRCWPWLEAEIGVKRPSCIVLLGRTVVAEVSRMTRHTVPYSKTQKVQPATVVFRLKDGSELSVRAYGIPHPGARLGDAFSEVVMKALDSLEYFGESGTTA